MSSFGYVANHVQIAHALVGIKISYNWVTLIIYGLAIIPALLYQRYEDMEGTITTDLTQYRNC